MYQLVHDIERYPAFLPLCTDAKILSADSQIVCGKLLIQKGPIQFHFSTRNTCTPHTQIKMQLLDGPFEYLQGQWQFTENAQGCFVELKLDFAMKGKLLALTLGPIFSTLAHSMVTIFSQRAEQIYG